MIVLDVHVDRIVILPGPCDPVVAAGIDRIAFGLGAQPMKAKARNIHVLGLRGSIQRKQDTSDAIMVLNGKF